MRFFGRNKQDESDLSQEIISDLKLQNDELSSKLEEILKSNKELEKEVYSLRKEHETLNQMRIDYSNLKTELGDLKTQLSDNYGEMVELTKSTTDVNRKLINKLEEKHGSPKQKAQNKHNSNRLVPRLRLGDDGVLYTPKRVSKVTIEELVLLKDNYNYCTNAELAEEVGISIEYCRLVLKGIKNGYYDDIFEKWENMNKNSVSNKNTDETANYHFVEVPKRYHRPYKKIELIGMNVRATHRALITIDNLISLKNDIPQMTKDNLEIFAKEYEIGMEGFKRLVWNIEEKRFDEIIDEYLQRNYTFSRDKFGFIYIDNEPTKLNRAKCKLMTDTIANESDKEKCIDGFIHTYSNIDPKYIRIICNEYNNPNLLKILNFEAKYIPKMNNPQKRRENGIC